MNIDIDSGSGFCFGVRNAVEIAERALEEGENVYCLGAIVHNDIEVERLRNKGLKTIDHEQFRNLSNCKVLIRAHGEPPSTYETARQNNITIIEATCPIVKRIQLKIRKTWEEISPDEGHIVLFGKKGHAEVVGLLGQTSNEAILINHDNDIDKIDFSKPVHLFSQTTMSVTEYKRLAGIIRVRLEEYNRVHGLSSKLTVHSTICGQVSGREPRLREFAASHDIIIFVSGRESSNGRMLFEVCRSVNPESYMIVSPGEVRKEWFKGKESVGVCGATSTPKWLIDSVAGAIGKIG
ncbi:MAG: 4-hydroxy-3-methylbut-2-enyl diphosphate reductase [Bacteroidales bacterium]|jgi:4-hydroxy-3-methylbut-2-enyl diphosphate reductase|nr:4-hydroxy-3-methylbut-2-enyl diphosphate reductase [Bacteroidales bacterium]